MSIRWLVVLVIPVLLMVACGPRRTDNSGTGKDIDFNVLYDSIRKDLKGAALEKGITVSKTMLLSDPAAPDSFILSVPAGLLTNIRCSLTVKSARSKVIYWDTFTTSYFVLGVFEPDSVPQGGQDAYEKYMITYLEGLSRQKIEKYASEKLNNFFEDFKTEHTEIEPEEEIADSVLYQKYAADKNMLALFIPCFDCDEGGSFYCYNPQKDSLTVLCSSD